MFLQCRFILPGVPAPSRHVQIEQLEIQPGMELLTTLPCSDRLNLLPTCLFSQRFRMWTEEHDDRLLGIGSILVINSSLSDSPVFRRILVGLLGILYQISIL
jgi:hypothetical protein